MSPHQTIAVAVRLFATWLGVHAVGQILSFYYEGNSHNDSTVLVAHRHSKTILTEGFWYGIGYAALIVGIGILLLLRAPLLP